MKYSIAIPAYKATYLSECIDSILSQTNPDFELIIVNDASPEDLGKIVNGYKDKRISYFMNEKNCGAENVVDNWNKCLNYATGEYFVLMGDDDKMESNYLEEFDALIKKNPNLDVYHCRSFIINEDSEKILLTPSCPEYESVYENMWHRLKGFRQQFISDFVYNRCRLVENGGFFKLPLAWASDDISAYIAMNTKGIAHTNKPIFNYRRSSITLSYDSSVKIKLKAIKEEEKWYLDFLTNKTPQNSVEKVFCSMLRLSITKGVMKRKVSTLTRSYNKGLLRNFFFWLFHKKEYDLSNVLIFYSLFQYITTAFAKRKGYKNRKIIYE